MAGVDLAGAFDVEFGGGVSPAGRPRLPVRLMVSLLYLENSFNLSDEELVDQWGENVVWQFFSGMDYYEPRLPCDATQIGRFRRLLGEDGIEQLLKATIDCAVDIKAVKPAELERVFVDSTVQSKAIAHPVDLGYRSLKPPWFGTSITATEPDRELGASPTTGSRRPEGLRMRHAPCTTSHSRCRPLAQADVGDVLVRLATHPETRQHHG